MLRRVVPSIYGKNSVNLVAAHHSFCCGLAIKSSHGYGKRNQRCVVLTKRYSSSLQNIAKYIPTSKYKSVDDLAKNLVEKSPKTLQPYLRLARVDKPVGYWLLMWPGLTGLALGAGGVPGFVLTAKFCAGAVLMRSIGCTINDVWDSEIDKNVKRTMTRPLPSGQLKVSNAVVSGGLQSVAALGILLSLNAPTIGLGLASLPLICTYPYLKRITYFPQVFLGLCMNYGLLMGVTASCGSLSIPAVVMYSSLISWTVFYDTIYALQDSKDDMLLGLKSTAIKFGPDVHKYLTLFTGVTSTGLFMSGHLAGLGSCFYMGVGAMTHFMLSQVQSLKPDDERDCLKKFTDHTKVAALLFFSVLLGASFQ